MAAPVDVEAPARNRLLAVLFVGVLMGALDIAIVGPALPEIQSTFGVGERALAWVFTVYVLFNLVSTPVMGKLSDLHGRRSIYVLDVVIFAVGSLVVAWSPSFEVLLAGRAVQGFGAGGIFPVASAVIGDTFPAEKRGSALGLIGAVFGIAFLVGPVLAGAVLLVASWPWLFLVNLPIAAGLVVASWRLVPATRRVEGVPFDVAGTVVLGVMMAALTVGVSQVGSGVGLGRLVSPGVWPFLAVAGVLVPVFRWVEARAEEPVLNLGLFRSRQILIAAGLAVGAGVGEAAVVFVPDLLVAAFGVASSTASFMLVPLVIAMAIGSPVFGGLLDRVGSRVVVLAGMSFMTVGLVAVGTLPVTLPLYYVGGSLVGLGLASLLGATLRYIFLNEAPERDRASAQGALSIFISVGQLVGGAAVGAIATTRGGGVPGYQDAFLMVGLAMLLLTLASLGLKQQAAEKRSMAQADL